MCHRFTVFILLIGGFVLSESAFALNWMSGQKLVDSCSAYQQNSNDEKSMFCASYVQGFLEGAEATDAIVEKTIRAEYQEDLSSYEKRAMKTRLGERRKRFGATSYAHYCIDPGVNIGQVINGVQQHLKAHPDIRNLGARDILYAALISQFPCK